MIQLLKMAYRDLGRNRRRSFLSALGLGMGLALLLLIAAVLEGEMRGALNTSIRLQSGHIQVRALSYNVDKVSLAWDDLLADPIPLAAQIAALPEVAVASPRLTASGMIAEGDETVGVRVIGIDPASEANAPYRDGMVSGAYLTADDRQGVIIGQTLARKLNLAVGSKIDLLVNTSSGNVAEQVFNIRGIYSTGTPAFDQATLFMPLDKAQGITQATNRASSVFVLLKDRDQTSAVAARFPTGQYQVETWEKMNEMLVTTEQMANGYMIFIYLIVLAVTSSVIVNTLVMAVFERTREIGILAAMGMKPGSIMAMFFAESGMLAIGGILIGLVIGGLMVLYATKVGFFIGNMGASGIMIGERIFAYPTLSDALTLSAIAFVVSLLAALYPALLASRLEPVQALHSGQ